MNLGLEGIWVFFLLFLFSQLFCKFEIVTKWKFKKRKKWIKGWWFQAPPLPTRSSFHYATVQSWYPALFGCVFCCPLCFRLFSTERIVFGFWTLRQRPKLEEVKLPHGWKMLLLASVRGCRQAVKGSEFSLHRHSGLQELRVSVGSAFWKQSGFG